VNSWELREIRTNFYFQARELVLQSNGLEQTRALAEEYVNRAIASIEPFPESEAKDGLIEMAHKTLKRRN
jgi:hexaprenyl-diphosphate synthase